MGLFVLHLQGAFEGWSLPHLPWEPEPGAGAEITEIMMPSSITVHFEDNSAVVLGEIQSPASLLAPVKKHTYEDLQHKKRCCKQNQHVEHVRVK